MQFSQREDWFAFYTLLYKEKERHLMLITPHTPGETWSRLDDPMLLALEGLSGNREYPRVDELGHYPSPYRTNLWHYQSIANLLSSMNNSTDHIPNEVITLANCIALTKQEISSLRIMVCRDWV